MNSRLAETPDRPVSRIHSDVEEVKKLTTRIETITERIIRHSQALGYFEPPPLNPATSTPTPVITNLANALQALDRAVDAACGALNVFD